MDPHDEDDYAMGIDDGSGFGGGGMDWSPPLEDLTEDQRRAYLSSLGGPSGGGSSRMDSAAEAPGGSRPSPLQLPIGHPAQPGPGSRVEVKGVGDGGSTEQRPVAGKGGQSSIEDGGSGGMEPAGGSGIRGLLAQQAKGSSAVASSPSVSAAAPSTSLSTGLPEGDPERRRREAHAVRLMLFVLDILCLRMFMGQD